MGVEWTMTPSMISFHVYIDMYVICAWGRGTCATPACGGQRATFGSDLPHC